MKKIFRLLALVLVFVTLFSLVSCKKEEEKVSGENQESGAYQKTDKRTNFVCIQMESGEKIVLELYPEYAPITVDNFQDLVEKGFYNGLTFHRISASFVIQGGDPSGDGTGGPGYEIKGEFQSNGVENPLSHERGVLSMARSQDPDSAGSQFFICLSTPYCQHLDGEYAAFGKVVSGMDVVDAISQVQCAGETPLEKQVMEKVYFVNPYDDKKSGDKTSEIKEEGETTVEMLPTKNEALLPLREIYEKEFFEEKYLRPFFEKTTDSELTFDQYMEFRYSGDSADQMQASCAESFEYGRFFSFFSYFDLTADGLTASQKQRILETYPETKNGPIYVLDETTREYELEKLEEYVEQYCIEQ